MIAEDVIRKIKEQNDIVDVISERVKLKKAGRNYIGLCPFHNEKSPSFTVSEEKQIYKCFGCGEAGNVISYIMKDRNVNFPEAARVLAERANISIEMDNEENNVQKDMYKKMYNINVAAARYFYDNLRKDKKAETYFLNRGITEVTMKKFGLGFSFDKWDGLLLYLKRKGYSELDLLSIGLIIKSPKNSYYDRFRNRIMFPVFDYKGSVIGFGGRVLDDSKPKYLNSPETPLFHKGLHLYGLNFVIKNNRSRTIIIVEGYMDCISLHQYGFSNAVASLGTALTINQAKLLKKHVDKVIISYDADVAGQAATLRGLEILRTEGFDLRVLIVPKDKDPDEYIKNNGKQAFQKLVDDALPLIYYRIKRAGDGINFSNSEMIIQYVKKVTEIIADLDPVEKDVYIKKVSEETGIKEQAIYDLLSDEINKNAKKTKKMNMQQDFGQKLYLEPAYIKAERNLLKFMFINEENCNYITENLDLEQLVLQSHKSIYTLIVKYKNLTKDEKTKKIEFICNDIECTKEWINTMEIEFSGDEEDHKKLINDCIKELKKFKLEESKKEIMNKIKQYESKGLLEESIQLAQKLIVMQKDLKQL
ncbi:DNA primase [Clostridium sp. CM027]|uniref:DNA primase n=1 Tax=Clostridium sp. CM027 TaxID=2849865 RepID=UPI001C6E1A66|nr:DNA primase [Clostridium sp. CM027]MBW9144272.1 DNA primase [Clostridium sp. CM027]UVE41092.1 DNA primase [Clostridium sp. CM027]